MIHQESRDTAGELLGHGYVQELVGTVCIRLGPEDTGNEKLSVRKLLAQHPHERNRTALSHVARLLAEVIAGSGLHGFHQPRLQCRCVPTAGFFLHIEMDTGVVGRLPLQGFLQVGGCPRGV